jgi:hypothetical protein
MAGVSRLTLPVLLLALTGLLHVAARGFLLMRRVRMILRLEVLGLVWRTFAVPGHAFSKFESVSEVAVYPIVRRFSHASQAGRFPDSHRA